jgi:hypothetical protein
VFKASPCHRQRSLPRSYPHRSTAYPAYTAAMFSETRYALNGDLRVAYRASAEGERDIVFVPDWMTCCDLLPELPSLRGWVEAMTSLGRAIHRHRGLDAPRRGDGRSGLACTA